MFMQNVFTGKTSLHFIIILYDCALRKFYMYPFKNLIYTREKFLARQCSINIEMARSAHVPLKNLTQEKNPYTLFPCSVGLCRDR